jgi:Fe-Mn family superoxide dismutase
MTRREAIKVIGGGAALVGMGAVTRLASATPAASAPETQPFTLPKLGYAYNALEPHIDALTMEIHHSKHHAGYIKNANKALEGHPDLSSMTAGQILAGLQSIPEPLRTTLRNNVGGHANHSLWWTILSPSGGGAPTGALSTALLGEFGSLETFKKTFNDAAMKRFGSGWAWLTKKDGRLVVHSTPNQDSPLSEGGVPILGIDVWEHAYYLKNQNRRADYVDAFWAVVNWDQAASNLAGAA